MIRPFFKNILDLFTWFFSYRKFPFVILNKLDMSLIIFPWEKNYIRVLNGVHDFKKEFSAISKLIGPGSIVIDAGANVGIYTIFCSRIIGNSGSIFSFEPVPDTFLSLNINMFLNHCYNVTVQSEAVGSVDELTQMCIFDQSFHTHNSLSTSLIKGVTSSIAIKKVSLDTFLQDKLDYIDLLKIDVEGFEDEVILGSSNLLKNKKIKYIQFEISERPLNDAGKTSLALFLLIESFDYKIFRFNSYTDKFEGPISSPDSGFDNYFASLVDLTSL